MTGQRRRTAVVGVAAIGVSGTYAGYLVALTLAGPPLLTISPAAACTPHRPEDRAPVRGYRLTPTKTVRGPLDLILVVGTDTFGRVRGRWRTSWT
jgi:hypothetical protein